MKEDLKMSFEASESILVIGAGGIGSKIATDAKKILGSDCLLVSNDQNDLKAEQKTIKIKTGPIVNPSVQVLRGQTEKNHERISEEISNYQTIVLLTNLAGKSGSAIAPSVARICREYKKNLISFVIMPFKYEKDRIFNSGISLKRIKENSSCTLVFDNDALLDSNPDLNVKSCYSIANAAILHVVGSIRSSEFSETSVISTGQSRQDLEDSLRDAMKMVYENAPVNSIKRSLLYILGSENVPVGVINSVSKLTSSITENGSSVNISNNSAEESRVVMVCAVNGQTRFDNYDPLDIIPRENTLDWSEPESSINCELDLYQLE